MWAKPSVTPLSFGAAIEPVSKGTPVAAINEPCEPSATRKTAIVYCEACFGQIDGKTANGLVRSSEKFEILSIIDSEKAGQDAGMVLDDCANGIAICRDLSESLAQADGVPDSFIFGMAPSSGMLSEQQRALILKAMGHGMNIVNGLHEFLNDDPVFKAACKTNQVTIDDVRRPRDKQDLRLFTGQVTELGCPRIAILGTDCAIGKRTTATILTEALNEQGIKAVMISTGQTGLIQGARYGVALDAVPSQFCAGELEAIIVQAHQAEQPDIIIVEGQGALSHPAFCSSAFILRGSCPSAVLLQHAPARVHRCDFEQMPMPQLADEINLIETFADTKVIGVTINHEGMTDEQVSLAISHYQQTLGIACTDALSRPSAWLVDMVLGAYPTLRPRVASRAP